MRIVSLYPAATEWICSFGAEKGLVGRSHACDLPAVSDVPVVTRERSSGESSSPHETAHSGPFELEAERLRQLKPDLVVLRQDDALENQVAEVSQTWSDHQMEVLVVNPSTLKQVFDMALTIGHAIGYLQNAMHLVATGERRIAALNERYGSGRKSSDRIMPTVAFISDLDPLRIGGDWIPDLVEQAGGKPLPASAEFYQDDTVWRELKDEDPDVILVALPDYPGDEAKNRFLQAAAEQGLKKLSAVKKGRVHTFADSHIFYTPGPGLYEAIELTAAAIHGRPTTDD